MRRLVLLALSIALVWTPGAGAWTWPADGPVLQEFSFGSNPYGAGQHRGIDVADPSGAAIAAPAGGIVTFAGSVPGGGKTLSIRTDDGYSVTLVHLGSIDVLKGAVVSEGSAVGAVGPSGKPEFDQPYVHLGIRVASDPQGYVDPLGFLPPRPAAAAAQPPAAPASTPVAETPPPPPVTVPDATAAAEPATVTADASANPAPQSVAEPVPNVSDAAASSAEPTPAADASASVESGQTAESTGAGTPTAVPEEAPSATPTSGDDIPTAAATSSGDPSPASAAAAAIAPPSVPASS
ncbi:MAG: hypothetical protein QOF50_1265, partial [Gaiellaceae bacterium]|nr:hypothetical protein [Gaiellaceae bacterium]